MKAITHTSTDQINTPPPSLGTENPAAARLRKMQQVHRAPRLANLQAEVDSELEVELAEDVDEELARDEKRGREQEAARKTAKQASEKAKPRKPTANKPGWTMNKWLEKILAKAKNLLADVPIPAISFPVVPLIEYSAQPQIPPRAKTYQDDKHWDEVTMDEAKDARKATDKNTDSYSDDEGWEVVDRQSGDEKDAKKAESKYN